MKKIFLTTLAFAATYLLSAQYCGTSGPGQCTANGSVIHGFEAPDVTPCIERSVSYDHSIQFNMYNVVEFQGQQQVDSIEFVDISNFPCGMCWSVDQADKRYTASEDGCMRITGTSSDSVGQYKLAISLKLWINGQSSSLSVPATLVDQMNIKLFLRVKSNGGSCIATDTSATANNLTAGNCNPVGNVPVADFQWAFYPYYPGNVVHFSDLSLNNPTSWVWSFGDGSGSTLQNPSKNFSTLGIYTVCLRATNALGTSSTVCKDVVVTGLGGLAAQLSTDSVCANSTITIQPAVSGGVPPYTYNWASTGDPLSCTTCQNPQVNITQNSIYTLTVIDAANTSATATAAYILNNSTNTMQISVNSSVIDCQHPVDTTTLTITNGTAPYTVTWGDGNSSVAGSTSIHAYTEPGDFFITVADNNNCIASTLNNIPFNGIIISASQTLQPNCLEDSTGKLKVTATAGTSPYIFNWSNGSTTDSITNVAAGVYRVTVTDATSCSFAKTFNLAPISGWSYSAYLQPSQSSCSGTGSIQTTVVGGTAPFSFLWSNNTTSQNLTGAAPGFFEITITDALGCQTVGSTTITSGCYSVISGNLFNDVNNNCTYDNGEDQLQGIYITASGGGQIYYGYSASDGTYTIQIPTTGTFTLSAYTGYGTCGILTLCNNVNNTVTITSLGDTSSNNNFGFTGSAGFDLNIHPGWTPGNPGFTKDYWIYCGDNSPTPFNGTATVTFNYDANLVYQASSPQAIHNLTNHTLTWFVDSLTNYNLWWSDRLDASFLVPQSLSLGQLLTTNFRIDPTSGDCDSTNNVLSVTETVSGSMDPNEKKVFPAGNILEEDSVLTYEIGFQNTGTDSTHFIIIKDTLSPNLDAGTVRNVASSHPYSDFSISGTGILTWTFNPLRLVDSFTNEPGSHGFVRFTIKKKKNLPLNTNISNTAHIYFDYNAAVVTNTVTNTLTEPNGIWHIRSTEGISVKAFPNPFSEGTTIAVEGVTGRYDFELYDVTGKLNTRISSIETNQFYINRDNLSAGIYFFKVLSADKKKSGYGKLVVE